MWELNKMPQERAHYLYLKHQLSAESELSPNKYNIPVGFNHAPNPLTWRGIARLMYHVLTFCIVPLVRGKCVALDIQRQIWQYKVKHDKRWRKLPWF